MSVNQVNSVAYGFKPSGNVGVFNPPIVSNRDPNGGDKAPLGTLWMNRTAGTAWVLPSIANNIAGWIVLEAGGGGGVFATLSVNPGGLSVGNIPVGGAGTITATGLINTTLGNITATVGNIIAGGDMEAGTGITSDAGNIVATTGNISSTLGSVSAGTTVTAGTGITATTGNIVATAGQVNAGTTMTAGTGITATTGIIQTLAGQIISTNGSTIAFNNAVSALASNLVTEKSRAGAIVQAGDSIGSVLLSGSDGTQFVNGASIKSIVIGAPALNRVGTNMIFGTHPDAASGADTTTRMTIASNGLITVSNIDTGTSTSLNLIVGGTLSVGGAGGPQVISGAGAPGALVAPVGSLYVNTTAVTTTTRLYISTDGAGTWANFTASA